ncbi:cell division protein SepF [bacterium]|nr:cell division protein SepF [bacterium]
MAVTDKIKSIVGFLTQGFEQRDDEDIFDDMSEEMEEAYPTEGTVALKPAYSYRDERQNQNDLKVVAHPNYKGYEVMVIEPRSFGEAGQIVQNLKERKTIVLNLHLLDKEQSQRTIDFVCGAAHALSGTPQKVGDMVFVFTPCNVTLSVDATAGTNKFRDSLWNQPQ